MAVDTNFDKVSLLLQGGSTSNVGAFDADAYGSYNLTVVPTGTTLASDHVVFGAAASLSVGDPTKAAGVQYGGGNVALDTTSMEMVLEHAWAPNASLFKTATLQARGHLEVANRYELFARHPYWYSPFVAKLTEFDLPATGKVLVRVVTGAVDSVQVVPESGAAVTINHGAYSTFSYPLLLGDTGESTDLAPVATVATTSNAVDVAGSSGVSTPSILQLFSPYYAGRPTGQTPSSGSATLSVAGITTTITNVAGMTGSAIAAVLASQAVALLNNGSTWSASSRAGGNGAMELVLTPLTSNVSGGTSASITGSAQFDAAPGYVAQTVPLNANSGLQQSPAYSPPPAVVQTQSAYITVNDPTRPLNLNLVGLGATETFSLQNNVQGAIDSAVAALRGHGLSTTLTQISASQWRIQFTFAHPNSVSGVGFTITESVPSLSAITKLYGVRVTGYTDRTDAVFPSLPWPTTSIPSSGGGGGGGTTLPADVWLALNFENGLQDLSSYAHTLALNSQVIASPPGQNPSRTGDTYVYASTTTSALNYNANLNELNGLTVLTIEFDIFVPNTAGQAFFFGATGGVYSVAVANGATAEIATYGFIPPLTSQSVTVTTNVWHHVAFVGGALECRIYVDGLLQITAAGQPLGVLDYSANLPTPTPLGILNIASPPDTYPTLAGLSFDNALITKSEKYSANFTPPGAIVGTAPPLSASSLYLKFEDGSTSSTLANSGSGGGPFPVVSGSVTTTQSRDGTGSFLTDGIAGLSTSFSVAGPGTGDYTAEMWVYFDSMPNAFGMFSGNFYTGGFFASPDGSIGLFIGNGGASLASAPGSVLAQTWYHIAATRQAGTVRFYLSGAVQGQFVGDTSYLFAPFLLGEDGQYGQAAAAYIDEYRFTNAALYTANFTPQSPLQDLTPPPTASDVQLAGYNTLDEVTGTGTFNTQATYPPAYFSANATLDDALPSGDSFAVDGNTINFTSSRTLAAATSTGTFVRGTPVTFDGSATAEDATGNSSFYAGLPLGWSGDSALEDASQLALYLFLAPAEFSGDALLDGVTPGLTSFSLIDPVVWRVDATVPMATLVANATQFLVNAQVPAVTLRASMSEYRGFELDAQVPAASLSAWAGLGLLGQVPMATLSASGTVVNTLRLDADLPRVTLAADASLGQLLSMSATVPAPTLSAWAGAGVRGAVPAATGAANVISGGAFRVDATVPAATATIGATSMNVLRLVGDVPAVARANWLAISRQVPAIGMLAHIAPVSAVTRVAYSFTLANSAMTRYPAYPFIQVIRMGNTFYGVAEDGLHEIGGTTDNAAPIPWTWETCLSDFGQAERKTVVSAYLGGYVPEAMTYTIRAGDVPTGTNAHATTATAVLRNHRQKFGIGRKSRYFAFGLSAAQGRVAIESIEFEVAPMSRRI